MNIDQYYDNINDSLLLLQTMIQETINRQLNYEKKLEELKQKEIDNDKYE